MIKKRTLQPLAYIAGACLLAGSLVGCGDDGGDDNPPDAAPVMIDAAPNVVDAGPADACVGGHGGGCTMSPFSLPEGGEFRLERFKRDENNTDDLAAHAFFFSGQMPEFRPLGGPEILEMPLREELAGKGYSCQNFDVEGPYFDNGFSQEAQDVTNTRTYYDVGAARLVNVDDENDPPQTIDLVSSEGSTEARADTDESSGLQHKTLFKGDIDTSVQLGSRYRPEIDGSGEYQSLDLRFGESVVGDEMADNNGIGTPLVYMPNGFTMMDPPEADFYAPKSLTFTRGEDKILRYQVDDPEPVGEDPATGGYPTVVPFIGFVNESGKVISYCFKVTPGELDNGEFIVPREVLEIIPAAPSPAAYVLFGRFTHVAWEVQRQPITRLDLLGVECLISQQWEVVDPVR